MKVNSLWDSSSIPYLAVDPSRLGWVQEKKRIEMSNLLDKVITFFIQQFRNNIWL